MTTTTDGAPASTKSTMSTRRGATARDRAVPRVRRLAPLSGPAFVVLVLAGNGLTETVAVSGGDPAGDALATFAAKAGDPAVAAGTAMELVGFVFLATFAAWLVDTLHRRSSLGTAGVLALVGAVMLLATKLASAAAYLTGIVHHETISPETALVLSELNGAGFVLGWLPWALFVGAAAVALYGARLLGRVGRAAGLVIGGIGLVAAVAGIIWPGNANPLPFLAGLLWTLVVGARVTIREWGTISRG